jgi:hypothetical protein
MDAARLIGSTRRALKEIRGEGELLAEAWQAQALAEAVIRHLVPDGTGAKGPPAGPAPRAAPGRGAALTEVRNPAGALRDLRELLSELGAVLVSAACSTEDEAVYWQYIEALDGAADRRDRVCALLREAEAALARERAQ